MSGVLPGAGLARVLTARGVITDPAWHRALLAVPRAPFVPDRVWIGSKDHPGWNMPVDSTDPEYPSWIDADYALITQVDDGTPSGADGWGRLPTSSISQPSLVVAMLEALDVRDGEKVLEIGTGTGYNTALLCERLGPENVVSIEVDEQVAAQARCTLDGLGYKPSLIVGDGAAGAPGHGPFDRVLATVAVHEVPPAWIAQTRPGGVIVTPWSTWFAPGVLLRLVAGADGAAAGRFVGHAPFMMLRDQRSAAPFGEWRQFVNEDDPSAQKGTTSANPRWISHRDEGWRLVVGHLVPGVDFASYEAAEDNHAAAGEATVYVFDRGTGSGSWALGEYEPGGPPYETETKGPRDLWEEIGRAWQAWQQAGRPGRDRLGLTVTPAGEQMLWVDAPSQPVG